MAKQVTIARPDGGVVCESCRVADSPLTRMRGLLGRKDLEPGHGLLIEPAPAIHTWFMRFAIDAVFLDRELTVLKVRPRMRPWRMSGHRGARFVLELRAGEAERRGIDEGSRLEVSHGDH